MSVFFSADFLLLVVLLLLLLLLLLLSFAAVLILGISLPIFDKPFSVLFIRWFWAPFFSQVVYALGVLVVTSASDVVPVVKRRFRLFD